MTDRHILVATGSDPLFQIDLNAFEAVRAVGTHFTRLIDPTYEEFTDHLERIRTQYDLMPDVHIAFHMNAHGISFPDKFITAEEISPHLTGVEHLFLAGCESTAIGDRLAVVPYVLTLLEKIEPKPARTLAQLFWLGIASGWNAPEAYNAAIKRLPTVAHFTYLHNHRFLGRKPPQ